MVRTWLVAVVLVASACSSAGSVTTTTAATTSASTTTTGSVPSAIPVIVDYSPTVSDVGGLLYLLSHPDVDVIAVSLPVTGEAGCDFGIEITLRLLAMADRRDVPVACDETAMPDDARSWPAEFLAGSDHLGLGLPEPVGEAEPLAAPDLIVDAARAAARPVVIWAVAPLTNVAAALERHPDLASMVDRVVIMGGAVDVGGNVDGSGAEWNVFVDAAAASAVVASGLPVTLIPLDATNDVPVPPWYGRVLQEAPQSDAVRYLELMVRAFPAVTSGFFYLWDELAATAITEPGLLVTETASIEVVTGGSDHGVTRRSDTGTPVNIATGVPSPDDFYAEFLSTLAGEPVAVGRPPTTEESAYVRAFQDALRPVEGLVASWFDQLEEEEFDPAVWDDRLRAVFTAFADAGEEIRRLEPPEVFAEIHALYLEELDDFAVVADSDIFERIAGTTSLEELFSLFDEYELAESDACMLLIEEASILGVTIDFC